MRAPWNAFRRLVGLSGDVTGTLPVANGGTGITSFGTGVATLLGTPSSANLAAALTDELAPTSNGLATFSTAWANFTPTVTLVGGAGNTVPVYTTNVGRWCQIGKTVFIRVYLTGDGGAEGAGTGVVTIALPVAVGASAPALTSDQARGVGVNNATVYMLTGSFNASATTVGLSYWSSVSGISSFTGDAQNNATRTVIIGGSYEVD